MKNKATAEFKKANNQLSKYTQLESKLNIEGIETGTFNTNMITICQAKQKEARQRIAEIKAI